MESLINQGVRVKRMPETLFPVLNSGTVTLEVDTGADGWQPVKELTEPYKLELNPGTMWRVTLTNDAKCYRQPN